jgi:hypothetical protein
LILYDFLSTKLLFEPLKNKFIADVERITDDFSEAAGVPFSGQFGYGEVYYVSNGPEGQQKACQDATIRITMATF